MEKDDQQQGFDVEAQKSLLGTTSAAATTDFNARKAFRKAGLLIRSAQFFKLGRAAAAAAAHDLEKEDEQEEEEDRINPSVETRDDFDVEAQLVPEEARSPLLGIDADAHGTANKFDGRKAFRRLALCVRSAHLFRLRMGVNCAADDEPSGQSNYTAITSPQSWSGIQDLQPYDLSFFSDLGLWG